MCVCVCVYAAVMLLDTQQAALTRLDGLPHSGARTQNGSRDELQSTGLTGRVARSAIGIQSVVNKSTNKQTDEK